MKKMEGSGLLIKNNSRLLSILLSVVGSATFFLLISGHYNIYTQLIIGYSTVILMILAISMKIESKTLILFLKFLAILIVLRYLYWRTFDSLTYEGLFDFIGSLLLYFAELIAILIYLLGIFSSLRLLHRKPIGLEQYPKKEWPSVDILIPTYNEPFNIVENTLLAATGIDYPKEKVKVYLLDDGGTDQKCNDPDPIKAEDAKNRRRYLQNFCEKVGVKYITRKKNIGAKAGNLNHALRYINGDLILVLDTDHVPAKEFLKKSVGWFLKDEKVFLVQTPHAFYNADPVERNLRMANRALSENDMFYKFIQLGHDFWESSFFCGSAAVLRRSCIDEIGGIAGETITEDAETALRLHEKGYKSVYLKEPMIRGLQPETLDAFLLQRIRWTQGMVQIFLLKNPLFSKTLKWHQKISYFSASFFWFFAFARVVFYLAPLAYLIFGLQIYNANGIEMISYVVPHILVAVLISYLIYARVRNPFFSELYETVLSFFTFPAILSVFKNPRSPKFKVTPKGIEPLETHVSEEVKVFVILFTLVFLGFVFAVYRWINYPQEIGVILMTTAWNLFNFIFLVAAIGAASEKKETRRYVRIPLQTKITIDLGEKKIEGQIVDISEGGVNIIPHEVSSENEKVLSKNREVMLNLYDIDGKKFDITSKFLKSYGWGKHLVFIFEGIEEDFQTRRKLVQLIYANSTFWTELEEKKPPLNPIQSFWYISYQGLKNAMIWDAYKMTLLWLWGLVFPTKKKDSSAILEKNLKKSVALNLPSLNLEGKVVELNKSYICLEFEKLSEDIQKELYKNSDIVIEIKDENGKKAMFELFFKELKGNRAYFYFKNSFEKVPIACQRVMEIKTYEKDGNER